MLALPGVAIYGPGGDFEKCCLPMWQQDGGLAYLIYRAVLITYAVSWRLYIVVVTKKSPMCQVICSSLYCMNGSIEGRDIN